MLNASTSVARVRASNRLPRITVVSYGNLSQLAHELEREYHGRAEINFIERIFEDAIEPVRSLEDARAVDVLVSAGANGAYLKRTVKTPVAIVRVSGFDLFRALLAARKFSRNIAILTYQEINHELEEVKQLIDLSITQRHYTTALDAGDRLRELVASGHDVIVGSSLITELAEKQGVRGIFLYSHGSVRNAIDDAIEIATVSFEERWRRSQLETVLARVEEGVLSVDLHERVWSLNQRMADILGLSPDRVIGKTLSDISLPLSLASTLRRGVPEMESIEQVGSRTLVVNRFPMLLDRAVTGAVLTCQDAVAIGKADEALRRKSKSRAARARYHLDDLLGTSQAIRDLRMLSAQMARTDATVLILGESGTGKEMFAQGIHNASARQPFPFMAINCAAMPESLIEAELFGHDEGAFTGARRGGRAGLFEAAHRGTVLLDEITEMPLPAQARLLRVLQEREVLRIGSSEAVPIDVRFIAATNRDITDLVRRGLFRQDLYYRLNIFCLTVPPLRERADDIPIIAHAMLASAFARMNTPHPLSAPQQIFLMEALRRYSWPGNVRELENVIERVVGYFTALQPTAESGLDSLGVVAPELFADPLQASGGGSAPLPDLQIARRLAETSHIEAVVACCSGRMAQAARQLGVSRSTLWRRLKEIEREAPTRAR